MSPDIQLFSEDFSETDSRLARFLRNQPENWPAPADAEEALQGHCGICCPNTEKRAGEGPARSVV